MESSASSSRSDSPECVKPDHQVRFTGESSASGGPPATSPTKRPHKRRKIRAQLSCNECRRLKLKCNREVPCSACIRRDCVELCHIPDKKALALAELATRPAALGMRLAAVEELLFGSTPSPNPQQTHQAVKPPTSTNPSPSHDNSLSALVEASALRLPTPLPTFDPAEATNNPPSGHSLTPSIPLQFSSQDLAASTSSLGPQQRGLVSSENDEQSFGTLVISHSGSTKFLGPTAASEWLKNQEVVEDPETAESPPPISRPASPSPSTGPTEMWQTMDAFGAKIAFPFNTVSRGVSTAHLLDMLPPEDEGRVLLDVYFRHFAWHFDIAPRATIQPFFDKAYTATGREMNSSNFPPHEVALLFIIFAVGAYYNLELQPGDPSVEEYLKISKAALAKGDVMATNTMNALKTMFIMAHLHLSLDSGKNGDASWGLWGVTSRMIVAMGLHRDGERWHLPPEAVEERRRLFWECHSTDVITSNCFSRPLQWYIYRGALGRDFIDTELPNGVGDFYRSKFEMSAHFQSVLELAMRVNRPSYSSVQALHDQIIDFERNLPYALRCRPVLSVLPSTLGLNSAEDISPPMKQRDMQKTLQQFTLALNISELLCFLHRPYFARAIAPKGDMSLYGQSFLAVIERCNAIVTVAANVAILYPQAGARHWWIWYHCLNSAASMGTLVLKDPHNLMVPVAVSVVDSAISSYTSIVWTRKSPRMVNNLKWLVKLREKMTTRLSQATSPGTGLAPPGNGEEEEDDVELLGWRTRLIERVGKGVQTAKTITSHPAPSYALQLATLAQQSQPQQPNMLDSVLLHYPVTTQEWMNDTTNLDWWISQEIEGVSSLDPLLD
ncbi:hypothetical protein T439DRAFT_140567 [Meredithblackwellia eburnea MCA 4105]